MLRDGLGREWPEGVAPDSGIVGSSERIPVRWLILAIFTLLRGVSLDDGSDGNASGLWYLFGVAAFLAFIADCVSYSGRKRQRKRQKLDNPIPLMNVLRDYGVEELGALYLYIPEPVREEDQEARAWLRVLRARQLVISGPWRMEASRAPPWLKKTHPRLVSDDVALYEIYRLKRDPLSFFL